MNSRFRIGTRQLIQIVGALCVLLYLSTWLLSFGASGFSFSVALGSLWKIPDGEILRKLGALYGPDVWVHGQWWRMISLGFLHGSFLHLAFNLIALFSLAPWIVEFQKPMVFLISLFVSIAWSGLASLYWADGGLVVGISGGVFGLAGGLLAARQIGKTEVRERLSDLPLAQLIVGLGIILFLGSLLEYIPGFPKLANAGHWGGLIGGSFVAFAFVGSRAGLRIIGWIGLTTGTILLFVASHNPFSNERYLEILAFHHFEAKEFSQAEERFRALLEIRNDDPLTQNALAYLLLESRGDLAEAEVLIEAAISKLPDHPDLLDTLGWLRCQQGDFPAGVRLLRKALDRSEAENEEIIAHLERCPEVARM